MRIQNFVDAISDYSALGHVKMSLDCPVESIRILRYDDALRHDLKLLEISEELLEELKDDR